VPTKSTSADTPKTKMKETLCISKEAALVKRRHRLLNNTFSLGYQALRKYRTTLYLDGNNTNGKEAP
jgi:hypothetical protein